MVKVDNALDMAEVLEELSKIRKLLEILLRESITEEVEKIATTPERKKIWSLCNGNLDTKGIAKESGMSLRAVQMFIKELKDNNLIKHERGGFPERIFDYVPYDWDE